MSSSRKYLQRYFRWVGESYVPGFDMFLLVLVTRPGRGGDHRPALAGYPAVRVMERNEDVAYQHGPNDVIQNMVPSYASVKWR